MLVAPGDNARGVHPSVAVRDAVAGVGGGDDTPDLLVKRNVGVEGLRGGTLLNVGCEGALEGHGNGALFDNRGVAGGVLGVLELEPFGLADVLPVLSVDIVAVVQRVAGNITELAESMRQGERVLVCGKQSALGANKVDAHVNGRIAGFHLNSELKLVEGRDGLVDVEGDGVVISSLPGVELISDALFSGGVGPGVPPVGGGDGLWAGSGEVVDRRRLGVSGLDEVVDCKADGLR